ncbi:hypothetical protein AAFF_G00210260 [Aldrovandia affinis]|uniref:Secreted protein n=1 Tax=Aldrovandia affinis TaxID=143900 RepID=A0AAD7SWJ0_9TELE|nr:hypothetical protein AAFF_G00210260 [Aldrovandia affinis]
MGSFLLLQHWPVGCAWAYITGRGSCSQPQLRLSAVVLVTGERGQLRAPATQESDEPPEWQRIRFTVETNAQSSERDS